MKKVLLTLGLVAGIVTNAQQFAMGTINGNVALARVTKDSRVYVTTHKYGTVLSADTLNELPANFRYDQGYKPLVLTPQISKHDHIHKHPTFKSELKDYWKRANTPGTSDYTILWGGIGFGIGYMIFKWITPEPTNYYVPSGLNNIPSGGGQCTAIAVSTGQRCKRSRESGSIYCWQHK